MQIRDAYQYIPFPYLSKSSYKRYKACKYAFKRLVIDKVETHGSRIMVQGTTLHFIYYKFFDLVDMDILFGLEWFVQNGTIGSPVYQYFYNVIAEFLDNEVPNKHMKMNIQNFCMLQENLWVMYRVKEKSKSKLKRLFIAGIMEREIVMRDDYHMLFGTVDRIVREGNRLVICDYKTGKVPNKVRDEIRDSVYTKVNLTHYTMEGAFYILLYLLNNGYTAQQNIDGRWDLYKEGVMCNKVLKTIDYAFIFTGARSRRGPTYYVARKSAKIVSIRSILKNIQVMRANTNWMREPNVIRCRMCPLFVTECMGKIPIEIHGDIFGGENTTPQSVHHTQ